MPRIKRSYWRYIIFILLFVGIYGLLPQVSSFHKSLHLMGHAQAHYLWLAAIATLVTYIAAAVTYCLLAFRPIGYWKTFTVQLAAMFVNRFFPAGVGGIGTNYRYLRKQRHTTVQAGTAVAVNNALGIIGHSILFLGLLALFHSRLPQGHIHNQYRWLLIGLTVIIIVLLGFSHSKRGRRLLRDSLKQLSAYRKRPERPWLALLSSMCLTLGNVAAFYFCALSLGVAISFITALLIFTVGIILGTATPTPGGLGGIEAGMVASLVAYHISSDQALAAVLLFRLITFWLPPIAGGLAFIISRRQKYL